MTGVKDNDGHDIAIPLETAGTYLTDEFYTCLYVVNNSIDSNGNRHYPFEGGWAEQPFWVLQALNILEGEEHKIQKEKEENDRKNTDVKKKR